ncbi:cupin-like domain-containing protein [Altererythrobacter sp. RZ02]|uniref:Cupin-like domain-containing protein n=1 Tax=Pontixanthobacter rizhaonensis TaxID=2730337 RepID=A0A848QIG6_9SPHN|nr:cupin-like domain-containing protein [Pontixanthobacter rizhaonensis]NMW30463.1 cupin-like domain-containing protein [Pontixanthobacter rizhaonensis]
MDASSPPQPVVEHAIASQSEFADIRAGNIPVVSRGLALNWPSVQAAIDGDEAFARHVTNGASREPINAIVAGHEEQGRFFYNETLTKFNFVSGRGTWADFVGDLMRLRSDPRPPSMAVQSTPVDSIIAGFSQHNRLDMLTHVEPRIWLGNAIRVAPHYDVKENVAVCVAGQRRFTLFPPEQTPNLYPGPFEKTPAGTPVSMVDPHNPDLEKYPRYSEAWPHALQVTLEPGDAIYIPYCWWHGVESLSPVSCLINYWWNDAHPALAGPYDALLHALAAFRHLPPEQRNVWQMMLNHYVFEDNGDPSAHLPDHAKGILAPASPELLAQMRQMLRGIVK